MRKNYCTICHGNQTINYLSVCSLIQLNAFLSPSLSLSLSLYIYIYIYMYERHHWSVLTAQIPLTLSHHPSPSGIALSKSSRWHPVSAQSWWMKAFLGSPTYIYIRYMYETRPLTKHMLVEQFFFLHWSHTLTNH